MSTRSGAQGPDLAELWTRTVAAGALVILGTVAGAVCWLVPGGWSFADGFTVTILGGTLGYLGSALQAQRRADRGPK